MTPQIHLKSLLLVQLLFLGIKLTAQPTCNWAYLPIAASFSQNVITAVATDNSGNIVEVGKLTGHADMNPGTGIGDTSFTTSFYNYYISKTSSSGQLLWIHYYQDNSQLVFFEFKGLKINAANEIIVAGNFYGKIDFDLSPTEVDTLRSHFPTYPDYFLAKYDSAGNYKWAINIGGVANSIEAKAINILPNNNIILVANPTGLVDVDPDSAIHSTISGNANIVCYDSNGNYVWNNHITAPLSYGVAVNSLENDSLGNSYLLSVGNYELTVTKFDVNGAYTWSKKMGDFSVGARVNPLSVLIDKKTGNLYLAGTFDGAVDFDPNSSIQIKSASNGFYQDGFIAKYDSDLNLIWVNQYMGKVEFGKMSLVFDENDIAAIGNLEGVVDFGNGLFLSSSASFAPFYLKIDTAGTAIEGYTLSGQGIYNTISTGVNHTFVISGYITGTTDLDPSSNQLNLTCTSANYFTAVYQFPISTNSIASFDNNEFEIAPFPNPFEDYLEVISSENNQIDELVVRDIGGRILYESNGGSIESVIRIKTSSWSKGLYFLSKRSNGTLKNYKLVKN